MADAQLKPEGNRLTIDNCHKLQEQFQSRSKAGAQSVTIDLSGIEFIDSSGLGALISIYKAASKKAPGRKADVILANPSEFVLRILDLTKTRSVFSIRDAA